MLREDSSLTPSPKHIFRRYHKIRKDVKIGDIKFCKVHTDLNGSDLLTKRSPRAMRNLRTRKLMVLDQVQTRLFEL